MKVSRFFNTCRGLRPPSFSVHLNTFHLVLITVTHKNTLLTGCPVKRVHIKIVLFSSHQMNYIEEFCDDIVILNRGSRVLYGNLREIRRSYPRTKLLVRSDRADEIRAAYGDACRDYERDLLEITLADAGEKQAAMARLVEQFSPDEIRVFEPSLNDIFIEYTQEAEETK